MTALSKSKSNNEGGPAFSGNSGPGAVYWSGMSLRQYFAASAVQGLLASGKYEQGLSLALAAYRIADDMLEAGK